MVFPRRGAKHPVPKACLGEAAEPGPLRRTERPNLSRHGHQPIAPGESTDWGGNVLVCQESLAPSAISAADGQTSGSAVYFSLLHKRIPTKTISTQAPAGFA